MTQVTNHRQVSIAMVVSDVKRTCILSAVNLGPGEVANSEEVGPQSAAGDLSKNGWCEMIGLSIHCFS